MSNGWVKVHRKLLDNPIRSKPSWAWLWIVLLLLANHDDNQSFIWNGKVVTLAKGQFVTGRKKLRELTGIPETTIERALDYFEKIGHQIGQQKTTKYRLITILNWSQYQTTDSKADNRRTTDGQQTDTFKNDKNDKNDKKNTPTALRAGDDIGKFIFLFKEINPTIGVLYGRQPQREAAARLLKLHPHKWWEAFMEKYTAQLGRDRYCPRATTPLQMEAKFGAIMAYAKSLAADSKMLTV